MGGNYSLVETVVTGQTITAAERNTEHQNHIDNATPSGCDDYSATVTEMRTVTDPYPASSESQATSLAGELERIRYLIKQITGEAQWYIDPESALTGYRLESADHSHQSTGAQAGTLDHGLATTGLTDDDHTQYALLAGRATGQVIFGGTAASETLTLKSTSHATKGKVIFGNAGTTAYDEVNERFGIGTASPSTVIEASRAGSLAVRATNLSTSSYAELGEDATGAYVEASNSKPLRFYTGVAERWRIDANGHLIGGDDNTYDIGASGATRPRTLYLGTSAFVPTITGSESASGTLTLKSTSDATKGKVIFGAAGTTAYDEVNERFGIGTASPTTPLHVESATGIIKLVSSTGTNSARVQIENTGGALYVGRESSSGGALFTSSAAYSGVIGVASAHAFELATTGVSRWKISSSGHLLGVVDNTYDIGAPGATRPRNVYIAGNLVVGGTISGATAIPTPGVDTSARDVTAWTTTETDLITLGSVTVATGDIIQLHLFMQATGAATTTWLQTRIRQSAGTAVVRYVTSSSTALSGTSNTLWTDIASSGIPIGGPMTLLLKCATGGTLTLVISAWCGTANCSASNIEARLIAYGTA